MTEWFDMHSVSAAVDAATEAIKIERNKLRELDAKIAEASTTVRSKDRSLSMTFDGRGELTTLSFNGNKYRTIAPAELGHMIVETLANGRAESLRQMSGLMGPSTLSGLDFADLATGRTSPSEIMDSLLGTILSPLTNGLPEQKEEKTDG